jgi:hypothetical protein
LFQKRVCAAAATQLAVRGEPEVPFKKNSLLPRGSEKVLPIFYAGAQTNTQSVYKTPSQQQTKVLMKSALGFGLGMRKFPERTHDCSIASI